MGIFDIDNILFTLGGGGVSVLEFVSVLAGLGCVFLAGRNNKFNFWLGYLYNILLFILFWQRHLYSAMLLQPLAFCINAFGHWRWTHPRSGEESAADENALKVTGLKNVSRVVYALCVGLFTLGWGFVLSRLGNSWAVGVFEPDPRPWLDSFVLGLTLCAQILSAQKKWDCWVVWLLVNIFNITLYLSAGLVFMPIVSALYLINGIWSLATWLKLYRRENP